MEELYQAFEALLHDCEREYELYKDDTYLSYSSVSALEWSRRLCRELRAGKRPETLLQELEQALPGLAEAIEQEDEHPTWSEYNEHEHALLLMGRQQAYRRAAAVLRNYLKQ